MSEFLRRIRNRTLPPAVNGGVPIRQALRVFRCQDCEYVSPDSEDTFAHVMSAHISDARRMLH